MRIERSNLVLTMMLLFGLMLPGKGGADEMHERQENKAVLLDLKILDVRPSETHLLGRTKLTATHEKTATIELGEKLSSISKQREKVGIDSLKLFITPKIIPEVGIELTFKVEGILSKRQAGKGPQWVSLKKAVVKNYEALTLDLLERSDEKSRIVIQATPMIQISREVLPLSSVERVCIRDLLLLVNDRVIFKNSTLEFDSNEAMFFTLKDKGAFLISFHAFKGGEVAGEADGTRIRLSVDGDQILIAADEAILPKGKWLVWLRRNKHAAIREESIGAGALNKIMDLL